MLDDPTLPHGKLSKRSSKLRGDTYKKKGEGDSFCTSPQCIFMLAELTYVGFQRYLKQKTTQKRIDSQ